MKPLAVGGRCLPRRVLVEGALAVMPVTFVDPQAGIVVEMDRFVTSATERLAFTNKAILMDVAKGLSISFVTHSVIVPYTRSLCLRDDQRCVL